MNAFITGSQVYGTPRPDSDLDLVVLVSKEDADIIWSATKERGLSGQFQSPMFGKLNVITIENEAKFQAWKNATDACKLNKPVSRDEAIKTFKLAMELAGVK